MRTSRNVCLPSDLPEDITCFGPVPESDLRSGAEVETPCYLHDPYRARIVPSVKVERVRNRYQRRPLMQTTLQRHAVDISRAELCRVWVYAGRSVIVCRLHVRDGGSHHGWRRSCVACSVDFASDQRGGRKRGGGIIWSERKTGEVRSRSWAYSHVACDGSYARGCDACLGQKCEPPRGTQVNARE